MTKSFFEICSEHVANDLPPCSSFVATTTSKCSFCGADYRRDIYGRRERDWVISDRYCSLPCNIEASGTRRYGEPPMDSCKTPISAQVRALCDARFTLDGAGCVRCPVRPACHSGPTQNLTFERLEEWRCRLNAAAAALPPCSSDQPDSHLGGSRP